MAFKKNENVFSKIVVLVLLGIPTIVATNIDCGRKPFHCVNSTHFMICVDLGGGVSSTIDNYMIPCPPPTECYTSNNFECEFPVSTTPKTQPSDVTNEIKVANETTQLGEVNTSIAPQEILTIDVTSTATTKAISPGSNTHINNTIKEDPSTQIISNNSQVNNGKPTSNNNTSDIYVTINPTNSENITEYPTTKGYKSEDKQPINVNEPQPPKLSVDIPPYNNTQNGKEFNGHSNKSSENTETLTTTPQDMQTVDVSTLTDTADIITITSVTTKSDQIDKVENGTQTVMTAASFTETSPYVLSTLINEMEVTTPSIIISNTPTGGIFDGIAATTDRQSTTNPSSDIYTENQSQSETTFGFLSTTNSLTLPDLLFTTVDSVKVNMDSTTVFTASTDIVIKQNTDNPISEVGSGSISGENKTQGDLIMISPVTSQSSATTNKVKATTDATIETTMATIISVEQNISDLIDIKSGIDTNTPVSATPGSDFNNLEIINMTQNDLTFPATSLTTSDSEVSTNTAIVNTDTILKIENSYTAIPVNTIPGFNNNFVETVTKTQSDLLSSSPESLTPTGIVISTDGAIITTETVPHIDQHNAITPGSTTPGLDNNIEIANKTESDFLLPLPGNLTSSGVEASTDGAIVTVDISSNIRDQNSVTLVNGLLGFDDSLETPNKTQSHLSSSSLGSMTIGMEIKTNDENVTTETIANMEEQNIATSISNTSRFDNHLELVTITQAMSSPNSTERVKVTDGIVDITQITQSTEPNITYSTTLKYDTNNLEGVNTSQGNLLTTSPKSFSADNGADIITGEGNNTEVPENNVNNTTHNIINTVSISEPETVNTTQSILLTSSPTRFTANDIVVTTDTTINFNETTQETTVQNTEIIINTTFRYDNNVFEEANMTKVLPSASSTTDGVNVTTDPVTKSTDLQYTMENTVDQNTVALLITTSRSDIKTSGPNITEISFLENFTTSGIQITTDAGLDVTQTMQTAGENKATTINIGSGSDNIKIEETNKTQSALIDKWTTLPVDSTTNGINVIINTTPGTIETTKNTADQSTITQKSTVIASNPEETNTTQTILSASPTTNSIEVTTDAVIDVTEILKNVTDQSVASSITTESGINNLGEVEATWNYLLTVPPMDTITSDIKETTETASNINETTQNIIEVTSPGSTITSDGKGTTDVTKITKRTTVQYITTLVNSSLGSNNKEGIDKIQSEVVSLSPESSTLRGLTVTVGVELDDSKTTQSSGSQNTTTVLNTTPRSDVIMEEVNITQVTFPVSSVMSDEKATGNVVIDSVTTQNIKEQNTPSLLDSSFGSNANDLRETKTTQSDLSTSSSVDSAINAFIVTTQAVVDTTEMAQNTAEQIGTTLRNSETDIKRPVAITTLTVNSNRVTDKVIDTTETTAYVLEQNSTSTINNESDINKLEQTKVTESNLSEPSPVIMVTNNSKGSTESAVDITMITQNTTQIINTTPGFSIENISNGENIIQEGATITQATFPASSITSSIQVTTDPAIATTKIIDRATEENTNPLIDTIFESDNKMFMPASSTATIVEGVTMGVGFDTIKNTLVISEKNTETTVNITPGYEGNILEKARTTQAQTQTNVDVEVITDSKIYTAATTPNGLGRGTTSGLINNIDNINTTQSNVLSSSSAVLTTKAIEITTKLPIDVTGVTQNVANQNRVTPYSSASGTNTNNGVDKNSSYNNLTKGDLLVTSVGISITTDNTVTTDSTLVINTTEPMGNIVTTVNSTFGPDENNLERTNITKEENSMSDSTRGDEKVTDGFEAIRNIKKQDTVSQIKTTPGDNNMIFKEVNIAQVSSQTGLATSGTSSTTEVASLSTNSSYVAMNVTETITNTEEQNVIMPINVTPKTINTDGTNRTQNVLQTSLSNTSTTSNMNVTTDIPNTEIPTDQNTPIVQDTLYGSNFNTVEGINRELLTAPDSSNIEITEDIANNVEQLIGKPRSTTLGNNTEEIHKLENKNLTILPDIATKTESSVKVTGSIAITGDYANPPNITPRSNFYDTKSTTVKVDENLPSSQIQDSVTTIRITDSTTLLTPVVNDISSQLPSVLETSTQSGGANRGHENVNNGRDNRSPQQTATTIHPSSTPRSQPQRHDDRGTNTADNKPKVNFDCGHRRRGRYSDKDDCRKFYVCIGRHEPIVSECPNNTVFSEYRKQCTKNFSHCVRGNEFQCVSEGRFSDFSQQNVFYICIKSKSDTYSRYKLQCQNGYRLDKEIVRCIENSEESKQSVSSNNEDSKKENKINKTKDDSIDKRSSEEWGKEERDDEEDERSESKEFECEEEGAFAHSTDCEKYYKCSRNKKSEFRRRIKKCDRGRVFNKDKKKCVDDDSYECL